MCFKTHRKQKGKIERIANQASMNVFAQPRDWQNEKHSKITYLRSIQFNLIWLCVCPLPEAWKNRENIKILNIFSWKINIDEIRKYRARLWMQNIKTGQVYLELHEIRKLNANF